MQHDVYNGGRSLFCELVFGHCTWVLVELCVQVLLFGVELVVDAVNCSHQSEGSHGRSDEEAHSGVIFVCVRICAGTNPLQRTSQ